MPARKKLVQNNMFDMFEPAVSDPFLKELFKAIKEGVIKLGYYCDGDTITLNGKSYKLTRPIVIEKSKYDTRFHIALLKEITDKSTSNNPVLARESRITCTWDNNELQTLTKHNYKSLKHETLYKVITKGEVQDLPRENEMLRTVGQTRKGIINSQNFAVKAALKIYKQGDIVLNEYIEQIKNENKFNAEFVLTLIRKINFALSELHKQGLLHLDIKADNLRVQLNDDGSFDIKIIDLGSAYSKEFIEKNTNVYIRGTREYVAPEVYLPTSPNDTINYHKKGWPGYNPNLDRGADIFSMGASIYHMIMNKPVPRKWASLDPNETSLETAHADLRQLTSTNVKQNLKCSDHEATRITRLLTGMLENDPKKRLTSNCIQVAASPILSVLQKKIDKQTKKIDNRSDLFFKKGDAKVQALQKLNDLLNNIIYDTTNDLSSKYISAELDGLFKQLNTKLFRFGFQEKKPTLLSDSAELLLEILNDFNKLVPKKVDEWLNKKNAEFSKPVIISLGRGSKW